MKPMSRGERGKKAQDSIKIGRSLGKMKAVRNPLVGGEKIAKTQVDMKGAALFMGFIVNF